MSCPGTRCVGGDMLPTLRSMKVLCLVLTAVAWIRLGPSYGKVLRPPTNPRPDYFQDWASARNYWGGLPIYSAHSTTLSLYLNRTQSEEEDDIEYNAHPPTSVLLALPLAGLELSDAVLAWNLISLAAMVASLLIVAMVLPELKGLFLPVAGLLPFCLPIYGNLLQAQLTFLLVLLVTASWALDRSGRPAAAGTLIGVAAAIKLFPAYLVVYFAAQRRGRALIAFAASFVALNLATIAVLGGETYRDYVGIVLPAVEKFRSYGFNLSLSGFWYKLFDPIGEPGRITPLWPSPAVARYGTLVSDLIVTAIVVVLAHRAKTPTDRDLAFGSAATAMLLVSPVTWDYSVPLLLVPIAAITRAATNSPWMPVLMVLILAIFGIPQKTMMELALGGKPFGTASPAFMLGAPSMEFYALLATFALGLAAFRAQGKSRPLTVGD